MQHECFDRVSFTIDSSNSVKFAGVSLSDLKAVDFTFG